MSVTVILNGYKRHYTMQDQYDAIKKQTYKDITVMVWINLYDHILHFPASIIEESDSVVSNTNYGVWGRFAMALNAQTKYVCIIDDDTIPGSMWIQNCIDNISKYNGILTTRGVIMTPFEKKYPGPGSYTAHGWCNPNEETMRVDFGCHCWFFEKSVLRAFWSEMPNNIPMNYGEDMHLSYAAQKHFGLYTYVVSHPKNNVEMWGSMPETGTKYGEDDAAISWNNSANAGMNKYWNFIRNNGYKIILDGNGEKQ